MDEAMASAEVKSARQRKVRKGMTNTVKQRLRVPHAEEMRLRSRSSPEVFIVSRTARDILRAWVSGEYRSSHFDALSAGRSGDRQYRNVEDNFHRRLWVIDLPVLERRAWRELPTLCRTAGPLLVNLPSASVDPKRCAEFRVAIMQNITACMKVTQRRNHAR